MLWFVTMISLFDTCKAFKHCSRLHRCSLNVSDDYVPQDGAPIHSFSTYYVQRALC